MNYAVIGTGWIAESYIRGTQLAENINLTAVYSRTAEKGLEFGSKFSCTNIYTDLNEFAKAEEFDSVYIASPNVFHYRQSKLMLENGKNVICEKPAAVTPEQLTELFELAESKGLIFTEAMMMAYNPVSLKIKEDLNNDSIVDVEDLAKLSLKYSYTKKTINWKDRYDLNSDNINGLNLYSYCMSNPIAYNDPNGLNPVYNFYEFKWFIHL